MAGQWDWRMSALAHTLPAPSVTAGWQSNWKRQERCGWPGRVTPAPPQRLGCTAAVAVPLPLPTPEGPRTVGKGARCRGYLLGQTKAVTFDSPGSSSEKTPACQQVGSAAAVLQKAHHCLGSGYPQKMQPADGALPHTLVFWLSFPLSPLHRPSGCWLVRLEWTGHHFDVIFLESKQHLTLFLSWWAARKVSCPATFLVVATIAVRHLNIFKLTSNSLCVLLQMNRQKTSWAERGALHHQSLDFSLSAKQRIQTPTMSSLLQTKNIYNLPKPGSGRAIQTVSSTS